MKPEEIKLSDWARIFLGQVPPSFYLELIIRAGLVYMLLMICMRLMGKRMAAQLSRLDMAALVSLAAAVGVPMLAPDRGILPAFIIAAIVVFIIRLTTRISYNNQSFEDVTQGNIDILVQDGILNLDTMKKVMISRDRVMAQLRSESVYHTGMVKRLYLEASGSFSMIKQESAKPGLVALPEWDRAYIDEKLSPTQATICLNCGTLQPANLAAQNGNATCPCCGDRKWTKAVEEK